MKNDNIGSLRIGSAHYIDRTSTESCTLAAIMCFFCITNTTKKSNIPHTKNDGEITKLWLAEENSSKMCCRMSQMTPSKRSPSFVITSILAMQAYQKNK